MWLAAGRGMTQAISITDKDLQHVLVPNALIGESLSKTSSGAIAQRLIEALHTPINEVN